MHVLFLQRILNLNPDTPMLMNRKCLLLLLICAVGCCLQANAQSGSIEKMEYWLDGQYADKQPLTSATAEIDIGDLSPGFHHISVRSKDDKGLWSSVQTKFFVIARPVDVATSVEAMEYWFDGKIGERVSLESNMAEIDIQSLSPGFHHISVRSKDDNGTWSSVQTKFFVIPKIAETATITHYCYWFDDDRQNVTIQTATNPIDLLELDLSGLTYFTEHTLYIAVCDAKGVYSNIWEETLFYEPITTGMMPLNNNVQNNDWYSLDGRKLDSRPTERGIYIHNGRKVVLK